MIQALRSFIFFVWLYTMLPVWGLLFMPWAIVDVRGGWAAVRSFSWLMRYSACFMVGIKTETRGTPPQGEVIIASKHQSFLDIFMITSMVPRPKFIMKSSLIWAPVLGFYGWRIGCIPVKRGRRSEAIRKMLDQAKNGKNYHGQLIIFPQGTRVPMGEKMPYKVGAFALYTQLEQTVVPVAANVGHVWPKAGIMKYPGTATIEFLPPIEQGVDQEDFMERLADVIETGSDALHAET